MKRIALLVTLLAAILAAPVFADDVTIPLQHRSAAVIADIFAEEGGISLPGDLRIEPLLPQNALRVTGTLDEIAEFREMLDLVDAESPRARITIRLLAADDLAMVSHVLRPIGGDDASADMAFASTRGAGVRDLFDDGGLRVVDEVSAELPNGDEAILPIGNTEFAITVQANPDNSVRIALNADARSDHPRAKAYIRVASDEDFLLADLDPQGELAGPIYAFSAHVLNRDRQAAAPARAPVANAAWVKVRRVSAEDTDMLAQALFGSRAGGHREVQRRTVWWDESALSLTLDRLLGEGTITVAYPPSVKVDAGGSGKVVFTGDDGAIAGCYWFEGTLDGDTVKLRATVIDPEDRAAGLEPLIFAIDLQPGRTFALADVDDNGHLQRPVYLVRTEPVTE